MWYAESLVGKPITGLRWGALTALSAQCLWGIVLPSVIRAAHHEANASGLMHRRLLSDKATVVVAVYNWCITANSSSVPIMKLCRPTFQHILTCVINVLRPRASFGDDNDDDDSSGDDGGETSHGRNNNVLDPADVFSAYIAGAKERLRVESRNMSATAWEMKRRTTWN